MGGELEETISNFGTSICTCIHTYVCPWGYITHPPGSLHTERLHMYSHTHMYTHTYIHAYIHTYTYTYICVYICTYICTYWREPARGRRKVPGTYITWILMYGLHTYVFRSHLGTISVKGWVALEPVGRGTSQRR